MSTHSELDKAGVDGNNNSTEVSSQHEHIDSKDIRIPSILDTASCHESTDETTSICSEGLFLEEVYYTPSTSTPSALSPSDPWTTEVELKSLVVAEPAESAKLRELIGQVVLDHEVQAYRHEETFEACNNNVYQLIWMKMTVPANQEILSLSTSIRYASKSNRGTVILGIADSQPDVDLRLHGIDEVLVGPLTKAIIRQKYVKWTSVQTVPAVDTHLLEEAPKTPVSPSSICSESMSTTLNSSQDLNLNTTADPHVEGSSGGDMSCTITGLATGSAVSGSGPKHGATEHTVLASLRNFNLQSVDIQPRPTRSAISSAADHTTKEKLRRERIKDSCDQLRVLLPYIRGRKTDMASILEMTVDYLKIITSAIPQDFQNQVVSIMSKGPVLPKMKSEGGRTSGRRTRREPDPPESPSTTRVSSTVDTGGRESHIGAGSTMFDMGISASSMSTPTRAAQSQMVMAGSKREAADGFKDIKPNSKRMHLPNHTLTPPNASQSATGMVYIQSEADTRTDPSDLNRDTGSPLHLQGVHLQTHMYGDLDANANRRYQNTFLAPDTYPMASAVTGTSARVANMDRDAYGMYVENAFYQYYTGQQSTGGTFANGSLSDYVNPNAVLPVAYSTRMVGNRKYEDPERFSGSPGSEHM